MQQSILSNFLSSINPNITIPTIQKHCGRPSKTISEPELNEILKGITSRDLTERKRITQKYPKQKIKHAINIFKTDYGKQGIISHVECPIHKRQNLGYGWQGYANGVRVKCLVPNCTALNTHFEPLLFHSQKGMEINGLIESSSNEE